MLLQNSVIFQSDFDFEAPQPPLATQRPPSASDFDFEAPERCLSLSLSRSLFIFEIQRFRSVSVISSQSDFEAPARKRGKMVSALYESCKMVSALYRPCKSKVTEQRSNSHQFTS
ncbi:unnamed protein product [Camellia sinensis]